MVSKLLLDSQDHHNYLLVPSGPPTSLSGSALTSDSIFLSWDLPLPKDRNGDITGYIVNVTNLDNETVHHFLTADAVLDFTVTNLEPFTLYENRVLARTALGAGMAPAVVFIQTAEDGI